MAVNRPRKPRRPRSPQVFRDVKRGMDFVDELTKQYNKHVAEADRVRREIDRARNRATQSSPGRSRRVPTSSDIFTQDELPFAPADAPFAQDELPFEPLPIDYHEHRTPVPLDQWDTIQTPDDEDDGSPWDSSPDIEAPTATEYYAPTRSIYPPRPRTREMSYNRETRVLRIVYRSGGTYHYFNVPGSIWYRIRLVKSPGRFINNNIIGKYQYERVTL